MPTTPPFSIVLPSKELEKKNIKIKILRLGWVKLG
jgi:hypothetical protein